jgi:hypothetical protein
MLAVMQVGDQTPDPSFSVATADAIGAELARLVRTRADTSADPVAPFARKHSLDEDRLYVELLYLLILTTQFAIGVALGAGETKTRVAAAFELALWAAPPGRTSPSGLIARAREYRDAFKHPHPELGRAYVVGRTLARHCNCGHEVAVIELGARGYMEQLPPMLGLLRSVTVV